MGPPWGATNLSNYFDLLLHGVIVPANAYQHTKFKISALSFSDIKKVFQNFMWGLLAPYRTPYAETFMCPPSTWQDETACQISASFLLFILQLCEYLFPISFPLYMPQNTVFVTFEDEDVKILCSNPKKHYRAPCVNTCLLVYRMSKSVQRLKLQVRRKCCVERNKKMSGNFGYTGRSNPWGDLDQIWPMGRHGRRNHVCNIWWLSVKKCGCGERFKFAFSHWLEV